MKKNNNVPTLGELQTAKRSLFPKPYAYRAQLAKQCEEYKTLDKKIHFLDMIGKQWVSMMLDCINQLKTKPVAQLGRLPIYREDIATMKEQMSIAIYLKRDLSKN